MEHFKGIDNGKDLLTIRKDPWAESKEQKSISKDIKGPKSTLGTLCVPLVAWHAAQVYNETCCLFVY